MTSPVLDASAILAFLQEEPGHEFVARALETGSCPVCAVNLSEVAAKLIEGGMNREDVTTVLTELDLRVHPFDENLALNCAWLREPTHSMGLSLADRACLALAQRLSSPAMTADRAWAALAVDIEVQLIRP